MIHSSHPIRVASKLRTPLAGLALLIATLVAQQSSAIGGAPPPPPPPGDVQREACTYSYDGKSHAPTSVTLAPLRSSTETFDDRFAPCADPDDPACPPWALNVDEILGRFSVQTNEWGGGWGAEDDPVTVDSPFGRLLVGFRVLERHEGNEAIGFAAYAADYVASVAGPFHPFCNSELAGEVPITKNETRTGFRALDDDVWGRAANYVHETRHHEGITHHIGDVRKCFPGEIPGVTFPNSTCCGDGGRSCDGFFFDWGPNSVAAAFLASLGYAERTTGFFVGPDPSTGLLDDRADDIVMRANSILTGRFMNDPGFRYIADINNPDLGLMGGVGNEFISAQTIVENAGPVANPTLMTDAATTACFLTKVSGKFEHRSEFIDIGTTGPNPSPPGGVSPRWELRTGTNRNNRNELIEARARCIQAAIPGTAVPVTEFDFALREGGEEEFTLESSTGHSCFLMGIRGGLRDSNDGAYLSRVGLTWLAHLRSSHSNADDYLSAKFGCIQTAGAPRESGEVAEEQTIVLTSSGRTLYWGPHPRGFENTDGPAFVPDAISCALSGVRGQFDGDAELSAILPQNKLTVFVNTQGELEVGVVSIDYPTTWMLANDEFRAFHTVRGNAECFLRPGYSVTP